MDTGSGETIRAEGIGGQVELRGDRITISRKGAFAKFAHGLKGDKEIRVSRLAGIQFKRAGRLTNGYMQFVFSGSDENKGGLVAATQDENTVMFRHGSQQKAFLRLKRAIEERLEALDYSAGSESDEGSSVEDLEPLARLHEQGSLTDEDFRAAKRKFLGLE